MILSISFLLVGKRPLKSESSSGVLFNVTIYRIPALIAASTPKGAFSTIIASDGFKFNL